MTLVLQIGNIAVDTLAGYKLLSSLCIASKYDTLTEKSGVPYQVPSGKVFRISELLYSANSIGSVFTIGYADTSVSQSVTPPTNPVYFTQWLPVTVANQHYLERMYFVIPANKFPFVVCWGGSYTMQYTGYEE